jgi:hypothetical protein
MATQTIQFSAATGLTLTAKLFAAGSDTVTDSQSATEGTNRKGVYTAAFTDVAAGTYQLIAFSGSTPVASWWVDLTLTTATFQSYEIATSTVQNGLATPADVTTALEDMELDKALIAQGAERAVNVDVNHRVHSHVYDMQANTITASALAADAVAEIQSGLATSAALQVVDDNVDQIAIDTTTLLSRVTSTVATLWANLTAMITGSGATAAYTVKALENAPGGGGGSSVNVLPATGIVAERAAGATLTPIVGETISQSITLYQPDGTTAVDMSGKTLVIVFETMSGIDVAVVASGDITISGDSSNVLTFAYPSAVTATERVLRFAIRDASAPLTMYLQGVCSVGTAPRVDT